MRGGGEKPAAARLRLAVAWLRDTEGVGWAATEGFRGQRAPGKFGGARVNSIDRILKHDEARASVGGRLAGQACSHARVE